MRNGAATRTALAVAAVGALALAGCGGAEGGGGDAAQGWQPDGDVTMIVPFSAGGGSDRAGRAVAAAIEAAAPDVTVSVENREGGSGAVGYSYFLGREGDAETLLATETALLALPAGGQVEFTYEDFTPIMKIAEDYTLLVVPAAAPYQSCTDVVDAARGQRVVAGISGQTGLDNIVLSLTENETGVQFDRVAFESGGELIAALLGGQIDIASLNPGEVIGQLDSGDLRAVCAFAEERYDYGALQEIPTATEQGIPVSFAQFRGVLAPGGIDEEQQRYWIDTMTRALETEEYRTYVEESYLQPVTAAGPEFVEYLGRNRTLLEEALKQ
ncbi:tripartite tricarboxylate transporter substrate binding protein [Pseudonocardia sichuanensis]|uniref:Putative tricarboxylic transport membrane protein n=1 Tax=Pseudonocardia kunmingensis TaxID=630975 RepID=A0A543DI75_9PSEU|nr:tripartite tricarboxylate transporter substrate binding protein [Pseudonocardia kunmingensis]TQM09046.1 putative tricarboxylic transport membrane protein [Pseudonocardia kunmingensis]